MNRMTKTSLIGSVTALVLIAAIAFNIAAPAGRAEAEELVNRSIARTIKITPEMRKEIEAKIQADMAATLEEAKKAPDLRTLTKEEFETEFGIIRMMKGPEGGTVGIASHRSLPEAGADVVFEKRIEAGGAVKVASGGEPGMQYGAQRFALRSEMSEPVKYLAYTDSKGRSTAIGLDEKDTVVMKMMKIAKGEAIPGPDGAMGFPAEEGFFIHSSEE